MSTITEALAEIKTISKRLAAKRDFVAQYMYRLDSLKDPLEKEGGSQKILVQDVQAISDLEQRLVDLRRGIQRANDSTTLSIEGSERSISDWLIWRREVAPKYGEFLNRLINNLKVLRDTARKQGTYTVSGTDKPIDIVVNIDEQKLSKDNEKLQNILGQLDGQLSLKNATVMIEV